MGPRFENKRLLKHAGGRRGNVSVGWHSKTLGNYRYFCQTRQYHGCLGEGPYAEISRSELP